MHKIFSSTNKEKPNHMFNTNYFIKTAKTPSTKTVINNYPDQIISFLQNGAVCHYKSRNPTYQHIITLKTIHLIEDII
jgi:hypothetical protein